MMETSSMVLVLVGIGLIICSVNPVAGIKFILNSTHQTLCIIKRGTR